MRDDKSNAPLILGVSGLRGIVGQSLTPEVATRYAGVFAAWLTESVGASPSVFIGRDGRAGGEEFERAVIRGLLAEGCSVEVSGVCMTPTVGMMVDHRGCDAGVILTASHNPQEWNGVKFLLPGSGGASAPEASIANELVTRFESGTFTPGTEVGKASEFLGATQAHSSRVIDRLDDCFGQWRAAVATLTCVVDSVNSSGSAGAQVLSDQMAFHAIQLFGDDSGIFPHTPEPTKENLSGDGGLCDAVPGLKADIGFAQDPDADRLAIVDENGEYIGEEYTLVLCAMALLEARGESKTRQTPLPQEQKPALVTNLSTSRMIEDVASHYGAEVHRTPVGEAHVVQRMKQLAEAGREVVLGGEGNGGAIWPKVVYVRDSLSGMALTLTLMARTGKTVSQLVKQIDALSPGGKGYCIVKKKVEIATKADAQPAVKAVSGWAAGIDGARVDLQDGIRVDFDQGGVGGVGGWGGSWVHVRASNTEAIMRLICEAPTETIAAEILTHIEGAIAAG